jgi:transcription elongation factor GreA
LSDTGPLGEAPLLNMAEIVSIYLSSQAASIDPDAKQELNRFGRSLGWERTVAGLMPHDVASYAEGVVAAGGDAAGRLTPIKVFLAYVKKKGHSEHSLAPHVKLPRASTRGNVPKGGVGFERIHMTTSGIDALHQEMVGLKGQREKIIDSIRIAAADKDFKENAPLDAAREQQGKSEGRIKEIEEMLRRVVELDRSDPGVSQENGIRVGASVVLRNLGSGADVKCTLVDSAEANPMEGKISVVSPLGQAVVGKFRGDDVVVQAPKGEMRYRITSINGRI